MVALAAAKEEKGDAEAMRQAEVEGWDAVAQAPPSLLKRPLMVKRRQW